MARLNDHDEYMQENLRTSQVLLQDLEGSIARQAMELNLGSALDDPMALFVVPDLVCRDLQGPGGDFLYSLPDGSSVGRRQQCGLLDEIDRVVDSLMQTVASAGLGTNNAAAELTAARAHKAAGEYKSAYARYRKAYRELASTHTVP